MQDCPSHEELQDFLPGSVPPIQADGLRTHISACCKCQAVLDQLTDSEALGDWTHRPELPGRAAEQETAFLRLRAMLRETQPNVGEPDQSVATFSWQSILGPPGRQGDLGTLGPYHIEAELGQGGMGIVFRAHDPALRRLVAVKVLRPERAHANGRRRLVREARTAAQFRHDHLVSVYAVVDPPDGLPYLVMEYIAGPTLGGVIRAEARLDPRRAAHLLAQVADGVAAAHAAGMVHRDIKADNIIIDPTTGRAKLMDFGWRGTRRMAKT